MNSLIDFSSRFRILKGGKISLVVSAFLGGAIIANAAPSGGVVTSGNATINQSGNVTNINQNSQKASINWNDFSIKSNETVNFNQPNSSSITLNRVIGTEKSVIDGALNSNGQVWILNSNGVLFNSNAKVNTSGLVATTAQLSDADFQAGNYDFKNASSNSIINVGTIEVQNGGSVVLASNEVQNSGTIKAVRGKVHLVGADSYSLNLNGNSLVNLKVNKGVLDALVKNSGNIIANGGEIYLTTNAVNELLKGVVNNTGIIEANSLDGISGKVELFAHGGTAEIGGAIEAKDGFVETSGKDFKVESTTKVKAKTWLIDPTDITVESTGSTTDLTGSSIKASFIESTLNGGTGVTLQATNNIYVNEDIAWNKSILALRATSGNVNINSTLTASGTAGLSVTKGGNFNVAGKVDFTGTNNFSLDGQTYTIIKTLTELQNMNNDLTKKYALGADIDASATSSWNVGDHDGDTGEFTAQVPMGWIPIGPLNVGAFMGNFDGLGHTVNNLTINRPTESFVGLFGRVSNGANISNIGVTNVNITAKNIVGGLVGEMRGASIVSNSYSNGSIVGKNYIGGLVGYMDASIVSNSYSKVNISSSSTSSDSYIGGLVGYSFLNSTINNSYATGNVKGKNSLGGLVGMNLQSVISNSYALGSVEGENSVGGLAGKNHDYADISNSYATGDVKGKVNVGGLIGENDNNAYIYNTYALGNIDGESAVGGLVGYITGGSKIEYSYAIGKVTHSTNTNIGGLVGYEHSNASITDSFYNSTINSTGMGDTSYGKTTEELQTFSTFKNAGWSIVEDATLDTSYKYPILNTKNGTSTWIMYQAATPLTYTLSGVLTGYIYNAETQLPTTWTAESIFGSTYSSWVLGTDYNFIYNTNAVTGFTNANTYNGITVDILKDGFTEASSGNTVGKFIISPKVISAITGITATNREYNGLISAALNYDSAVFTGMIDGDSLTASATGTFADKNAGENKTVNISSITLGGTDAGNYTLDSTTATTTATISKKALTITNTTAQNKTYDGTTDVTETLGTLSGFVGSETVSATAVGTFASKDAGTRTATFVYTLADGENDGLAFNYSLANTTDDAQISKANAIVTANSDTKTYNGLSQSANNFSATGLVNGETIAVLDGVSASGAGTNVGTYAVTLSGIDENYNLTYVNGSLTISKANVTVTANSDTKTYSGLSQTVNGYTVSGLVNGETSSVIDSVTGATSSGTNAGEYITTLAGSDDNYNLTFVDGKLTITPKQITVNANNLSKIFGENDPILTYIAQGIIGDDNLDGLIQRARGENAGEYTISKGTLANQNYNIAFNNGILTIKRDTTLDNAINSIANTTAVQIPKVEIIIPKIAVAPQAQPIVIASTGNQVNVMSQPIQNQNTTMVTMGELRANQDTNTPNGNSDIRVPVGDNSVIELINGGVNLPNGVEQQFFVVNNENNNI